MNVRTLNILCGAFILSIFFAIVSSQDAIKKNMEINRKKYLANKIEEIKTLYPSESN
jgi:hypothetical protein